MKRVLLSIIITMSLVLSTFGSSPTVQAVQADRPVQTSSPVTLLDQDQDGLSNTLETAGWYSLAGGPYRTNPNKADTDGDGLTDAEEKLFNTDPTDAHSPGISVRYESAFKTFEYYNAKDPAYLALRQGGNRYLLTEGLVVRRGTTFKIATVNSAGVTLTLNGTDMTPLTPVRDPARGGWLVTLPVNGTVGQYTATITDGAWSKSLPIYVIFELPTGLTQAQMGAYLYDDDPANKRDEIAVWWRASDWPYYNDDSPTPTPCNPGDPICSDWPYHTLSGYAQAFWTEQFTKNVLVTYTVPALQGRTSPYDAAAAIGEKADASVRVNFSSVKNSFSSATRVFYDPHHTPPYSSNGGACETSAGVFTAMLRSAGIPSRPFAMDYNKTETFPHSGVGAHGEGGSLWPAVFEYDHAVLLWAVAPGVATNRWYAERIFNGAEAEYQSTPAWASGTTGIHLLADIGVYNPPAKQFKKFQDFNADAIQSVNEGWDFQNGSLGGGMVNTEWTGTDVPDAEFFFQNRDFKWNSQKPLEIQQSPFVDVFNCQLWKGDGWAPSEWRDPSVSSPAGRTAAQTYILPVGIPSAPTDLENWPYNPKPTSCSDSTSAAACAAFKATWQAVCAALPGQVFAAAQAPALPPAPAQVSALNTAVQLGRIVADFGLDQNGDGRFDQLVVRFELNSSVAGAYQLGGWLRLGEKVIRADVAQVALVPGLQTLEVTFAGQVIGDNQADGPYQVEALWLAPADQTVSELALPEEMTAYQTYTYDSQAYAANAFTVRAASIAGNYAYFSTDTNANGLVDAITIAVPLRIAIPGTFTVEGDLYDGGGNFVGHAAWTGSDAEASLTYAVAGTPPPYALEHLNLVDAQGQALSSFYAPVYQIKDLGGRVDLGSITPASSSTGVALQTITPSNAFVATPKDTNGNGLYDQLVVSTLVDVTTQGGAYYMEGVLADDRDLLVAWSDVGAPQTLGIGQNQTLQMTFDGRMLFSQQALTGNQKFTLIAVKIFSVSGGSQTLEAEIPVTGLSTASYARTQFEPFIPALTPFQDDMEDGTTNWNVTGSSQWSRTTAVWHSGTHAWMAAGSSSKSGLLTLAQPLDFTGYAGPWLWFDTAYDLANGQSATLEVSTNGTDWSTLKTYTGSTAYWTTEMIDLSAYGQQSGVRVRFNAHSNPGATWYIDDVVVVLAAGSAPMTNLIYLPAVVR
jgi:hypothetical protein